MAINNLQQLRSNKWHTLKIKIGLKSLLTPRPNLSLTKLGDEVLSMRDDPIQSSIMVFSHILTRVE